MDRYLKGSKEKFVDNSNILGWWRIHGHMYGVWALVAQDVLAIKVSKVASESTFSMSGRILDPEVL